MKPFVSKKSIKNEKVCIKKHFFLFVNNFFSYFTFFFKVDFLLREIE